MPQFPHDTGIVQIHLAVHAAQGDVQVVGGVLQADEPPLVKDLQAHQGAHHRLPPAGGAGDAAGQAVGRGLQRGLPRVDLQVAPQGDELLPAGQQGLRLLPGEGLPPAELLVQGPLGLGPGEDGAQIAELELDAPPPCCSKTAAATLTRTAICTLPPRTATLP